MIHQAVPFPMLMWWRLAAGLPQVGFEILCEYSLYKKAHIGAEISLWDAIFTTVSIYAELNDGTLFCQ